MWLNKLKFDYTFHINAMQMQCKYNADAINDFFIHNVDRLHQYY